MLPTYRHDSRRRGASAVVVAISLSMLLGFGALAVDMGMLYNVRGDLQRTADAAALAGAIALMDNDRLKGSAELQAVVAASRTQAATFASRNAVYGLPTPSLGVNDASTGYLSDPTSATEALSFADSSLFNAVRVRVRRDATSNGPVELMFARIFGENTTGLKADATAAFMDGINGFRVTPGTGNAGLLPITLKTTAWNNLLDETFTSGDNYSYNPNTGQVTSGPDGILELNLFPGGGASSLPPGNFGTVDIGSPNNSTADISRQILEGVSAEDLAYFGGELKLGPTGELPLNGETGLSAAIASDLTAIVGQARTIPLFSTVSGPGNNANFTIVGFAGIRIMYVKLTGAMSGKRVMVQPALVVDDSALAGPSTGSSYYVYQPVRLVR